MGPVRRWIVDHRVASVLVTTGVLFGIAIMANVAFGTGGPSAISTIFVAACCASGALLGSQVALVVGKRAGADVPQGPRFSGVVVGGGTGLFGGVGSSAHGVWVLVLCAAAFAVAFVSGFALQRREF